MTSELSFLTQERRLGVLTGHVHTTSFLAMVYQVGGHLFILIHLTEVCNQSVAAWHIRFLVMRVKRENSQIEYLFNTRLFSERAIPRLDSGCHLISVWIHPKNLENCMFIPCPAPPHSRQIHDIQKDSESSLGVHNGAILIYPLVFPR